ncbi:MAG: ASCH domain-containing protein, partial [Mobilitalea sp.]
ALCVASCSGQAIFLVNEEFEPGFASITLPYEFLPLPIAGDKGIALDRSGKAVCDAEIIDIKSSKVFDHTHILTMKVTVDMAMSARFFRRLEA